jgi:hypothetical protein
MSKAVKSNSFFYDEVLHIDEALTNQKMNINIFTTMINLISHPESFSWFYSVPYHDTAFKSQSYPPLLTYLFICSLLVIY